MRTFFGCRFRFRGVAKLGYRWSGFEEGRFPKPTLVTHADTDYRASKPRCFYEQVPGTFYRSACHGRRPAPMRDG